MGSGRGHRAPGCHRARPTPRARRRWHLETAAFATWEAFTGVALSFGLIVLYRRWLDAQGRVARYLSDNAFAVYVFHPPIVIIGARLMHGIAWPPLVKFVVLTAFAEEPAARGIRRAHLRTRRPYAD